MRLARPSTRPARRAWPPAHLTIRIYCYDHPLAIRCAAVVDVVSSPAPGKADRPGPGEPPHERIKLVCFRLHGQEYAADIADVKETMAVRPVTRVFLTPAWLAGIINLRGDIVAVIDLGQLLDLAPTVITAASRIIICRPHGQPERVAGIVVDELAELRILDPRTLQPPPPTLTGDAAALLRGVATVEDGAPLRVLQLADLFECERVRALQRKES